MASIIAIYTITVFNLDKDKNFGGILDSRCVGYYESFKDAEEAVLNNACDIAEYTYHYAVIEEIEPGLYECDINPKFYEADFDLKYPLFHRIERPEQLKNICGFSIG